MYSVTNVAYEGCALIAIILMNNNHDDYFADMEYIYLILSMYNLAIFIFTIIPC